MCQDGIKRSSKGSKRSRGSIRDRDRYRNRNRSSPDHSRNINRIIYGVRPQAFPPSFFNTHVKLPGISVKKKNTTLVVLMILE